MSTDQKKKKMGLKSWLDGDMLLSPFLQRHLGLIILIFALIIVYVSNRYAFQREQVQIKQLREQLDDVKFELDTRQLKEILGDVPLSTPDVMGWIYGYYDENSPFLNTTY